MVSQSGQSPVTSYLPAAFGAPFGATAVAMWLALALLTHAPAVAEANEINWNIPLKTLGGVQVWSDGYVHAGWRIQQNVLTSHWRLLDPEDVRRAWGDYDGCMRTFNEIRTRENIKPVSTHMVMAFHGISPKPLALKLMERRLKAAGYDAVAISYASTRDTIEHHAIRIEAVLNRTKGTKKVSFVTHSMGGLVLRYLLHRDGAWKRRITVGRIIQIAPPNRGAVVAQWIADLGPYKWILGESGQQLTPDATAHIPQIDYAFGVIAGGKNNQTGFNPVLPGDDDGMLGVAETKLPGMTDFLIVNADHTDLLQSPVAIQATLNFLDHGTFSK